MKYFKLILFALANSCLYWLVLGYVSNNIFDFSIDYYDLLWIIIIGGMITSVIRFAVTELWYRFSDKDKLASFFYGILTQKGFPNPRNYYIDDGITYLLDVSNDSSVDGGTRVQSMRLWSEINMLSTSGNIFQSNRFKYALAVAVNRYFRHFEDEYQTVPDLDKSYGDASRNDYSPSYLLLLFFN